MAEGNCITSIHYEMLSLETIIKQKLLTPQSVHRYCNGTHQQKVLKSSSSPSVTILVKKNSWTCPFLVISIFLIAPCVWFLIAVCFTVKVRPDTCAALLHSWGWDTIEVHTHMLGCCTRKRRYTRKHLILITPILCVRLICLHGDDSKHTAPRVPGKASKKCSWDPTISVRLFKSQVPIICSIMVVSMKHCIKCSPANVNRILAPSIELMLWQSPCL